MNLSHFRVFRAVADCENYTKAAERLYLTQPTVYMQVRSLERELGCRLFDQVGKRAVLTAAGRALLPYAGRFLALEKETTGLLDELKGLQSGELTIGAGPIAGNYLLPSVMASFKRLHRGIDLKVQIYSTGTEVADRVMALEVDLGFGTPPAVLPEPVVVDEIWSTELVACVGPDHPLLSRRLVTPQDLGTEVFVWIGPLTVTWQLGNKALSDLAIQPPSAMILNTPEAAKGIVMGNFGVAILPRPAVAEELRTGRLILLSIPGFKVRFAICCLRHGARHLSPAAQAFLDLAKTTVKEP